jgi:uncharacterized protein (TIGR00255 family)
MTGFASAVGAVAVEVRSVNSRFLDLSLRLPDEFRALEPALRDILTSAIRRGKVELRLFSERSEGAGAGLPASEQVATQLADIGALQDVVRQQLPGAAMLSVHEILQWCRNVRTARVADEQVLELARRCAVELREARAREGARLVEVLLARVSRLRELARDAEPLLPQVVARQQERFLSRWNEALASAGAVELSASAVTERALSEAAAFALRIDVAEELSRLIVHLDEIERLLAGGGEVGKRLDFLIQELHREANTLGSKSASIELTRVSIDMKVQIEQMREQVQNLE